MNGWLEVICLNGLYFCYKTVSYLSTEWIIDVNTFPPSYQGRFKIVKNIFEVIIPACEIHSVNCKLIWKTVCFRYIYCPRMFQRYKIKEISGDHQIQSLHFQGHTVNSYIIEKSVSQWYQNKVLPTVFIN